MIRTECGMNASRSGVDAKIMLSIALLHRMVVKILHGFLCFLSAAQAGRKPQRYIIMLMTYRFQVHSRSG